MTDLLQVLPDFDLSSYLHLTFSIGKANVTTNDLITVAPIDIAKRARIPTSEVKRLADDVVKCLHEGVGVKGVNVDQLSAPHPQSQQQVGVGEGLASADSGSFQTISTLDNYLDVALKGGFPVGQLTEVAGESASGKSHLLLSLLLAVQLPPPHGLNKDAIYMSTEASLRTGRLTQFLENHPHLASMPGSERPSLDRIHTCQLSDLQEQEHMLRYQVPVMLERNSIGLIIIDSIAATFRAEFESSKNQAEAMGIRARQLVQLGSLLRQIARTHNVAIVVANQVSDRFVTSDALLNHNNNNNDNTPVMSQRPAHTNSGESTSSGRSTPGHPAPHPKAMASRPMTLNLQQCFFTGWGDYPGHRKDLKTPALGLVWTKQLAGRITLTKEPIMKHQDYLLGLGMDVVGWRRWMKVAFANWCPDHNGKEGVPFELWDGGVRGKGNHFKKEEKFEAERPAKRAKTT